MESFFGVYEDRAGYFYRFYDSLEDSGSVRNARLVTMCAIPVDRNSLKKVGDIFYDLRYGVINESDLRERLNMFLN